MSERYSGQVALNEFEALRPAAGAHASRLEGHGIDVTNDAAVHQMISSVVAKHGRLDAMTNAVGDYGTGWKLWEAELTILDQIRELPARRHPPLC